MKILRVEKDGEIREVNMANADLHSCKDYGATTAAYNKSFNGLIPWAKVTSGAEHIYFDDGTSDDVIGIAFVISDGVAPDNLVGVTAVSANRVYHFLSNVGGVLKARAAEVSTEIDEADFMFCNMCYSHSKEKAYIFTVQGGDLYSLDGVEV